MEIHFIFVPIFTSNDFRNWDMQRELTDVQRENERDRVGDRAIDLANAQREKDRAVDRDLAFASIAISRSTAPISPLPTLCDLAPRRTQSPLSLPSLNLTGFDDFFFGFCPCFSGFCLFLLLFQTLENIFRNFFWNATKHMKTFSFPENNISGKYQKMEYFLEMLLHEPNTA